MRDHPGHHLRTRCVRTLPVLLVSAGLLAGMLLASDARAYPRPGATERVSVGPGGVEADGGAGRPSLSDDGRYVAFSSHSTNLLPGDTNGLYHVFVHDRQTGVTERVSVASDGTEGNGDSSPPLLTGPPFGPSISGDGRYVAFRSSASNLVPGDTNGVGDIFVHDRQTGTTERVSVASDGTQADRRSSGPSISADGRQVAFHSSATNLVPAETTTFDKIFVHDRQTGTTELVSVNSDGAGANSASREVSISADGRHVAFMSFASNLDIVEASGWGDVFVHDRQSGTTEQVSVALDGQKPNDYSVEPSISGDGRSVAFHSRATNLVPDDTYDTFIYVRDLQAGTTERVSVTSAGELADGPCCTAFSRGAAISHDGRHVAFYSVADNLAPDDTNGRRDVFVHDRETGVTERVSVASDGTQGSDVSSNPAISGDGRHVGFDSHAPNLVGDDTNSAPHVFVRDRGFPLGVVGDLSALEGPGGLAVTGRATVSGAGASQASDPDDDGGSVGPVTARELGAEIVGAAVIDRTEEEDLLLRLRLAVLPKEESSGVLYGWSFSVGETAYEVRGVRHGAWRPRRASSPTSAPPSTSPRFALYRCALVCTETSELSGGLGATGAEVRVSVHIESLAAQGGDTLTDVRAWTALGETSLGLRLAELDQVDLPDASILPPRVELGMASVSTPEEEVAYTAQAALVEGHFSETIDTASLSGGPYRVWARVCLGSLCGPATFREVAV